MVGAIVSVGACVAVAAGELVGMEDATVTVAGGGVGVTEAAKRGDLQMPRAVSASTMNPPNIQRRGQTLRATARSRQHDHFIVLMNLGEEAVYEVCIQRLRVGQVLR